MGKIKVGGVRGKVRGRVGSESYSILNRQQIVRSLPDAVKNPQTSAQMEQRARLANLVAFYRANKFWMHWGAFQTKKEEWSDYNSFVSANMKMDAVYLTKSWAEAGATVVAPYVVSVGSLPRINVTAAADVLISDIYVGSELAITNFTPIGTISAAILAHNNAIQEGDQISIIVEIQQSTEQSPYVTARAFELIVNPNDTSTVADRGLSGILTVDGGTGYEALSVQLPSEQGGGTFILSREDSNGLRVSSQEIVLSALQETYLATFKTASAKAAYLKSYGSDDTQNFLSSGYSSHSSEGGVSLPQQIMTVNGKAAGSYFGECGPSLTVIFAQSPSGVTGGTATNASNQEQPINGTWITLQGNTATIDMTGSSSFQGNILKNLSLVVDSETISIDFSPTQPEIDE